MSKPRSAAQGERKSPWRKTQYSNLVRYVPSGVYFARVRVAGKLLRRSLKTQVLSVAKLKLSDFEKQERAKAEAFTRLEKSDATFADLLSEYRRRLESNHTIKPRTREYREERIGAILRTWPELQKMDVGRITRENCEEWASRFVQRASPSNFNNSIGTLKAVLQIAVEKGLRYSNPAAGLKRVRVKPKQLVLPAQDQFVALVKEIRRVHNGPTLASADLVEFLAYGGFRKGEASHVTWLDCDFDKGQIVVKGDPVTGTKNGEVRRVPMIPDMLRLLQRLHGQSDEERPESPVMKVRECQGALNRACKNLGIARFTHHDLRHLFATRCIESGVDIPTVSRWLGHKDGGALAMRVYGHLRDQHSVEMAQKVSFDSKASDDKAEKYEI